ncbi:hypothetical protein [Arthrobacter sp. NPDC057013]|uniref:hypothetical protein n=1 Tax=Arthrobacter sp. NPDC057013 TaxID=3345999 RepID=UPI00363D4526
MREYIGDRPNGKLNRQSLGHRAHGVRYWFYELGNGLSNLGHRRNDGFGRVCQYSISHGGDGIGNPGRGVVGKRPSNG